MYSLGACNAPALSIENLIHWCVARELLEGAGENFFAVAGRELGHDFVGGVGDEADAAIAEDKISSPRMVAPKMQRVALLAMFAFDETVRTRRARFEIVGHARRRRVVNFANT